MQRNQADERHPEIHRAIRTIHHHRHADDVAAVRADDVQSLLHAATLRDNILDDENFFTRRNFEAASQNQFAVFFLHENKAQAKLPRNFLPNHKPAHRRSDDRDRAERF